MNVVIAVDGSSSSRHALEFAGTLLAGREVSVLLVHIIPEHLIYGKGGVAPAEVYDMPKEQSASRALLEESAERLRTMGVGPAIEVQVCIGDPAELILTRAADAKADLIVLGSRGLNAAQRFLIGSVSTKVVNHAHCAVLVARPNAGE
jgi:nucleotide-binding universal stress UspA family protein